MAGTTPESSSLITKVNVTPIIDVALVLVIILLVTAPLITVSDLPVNLPQARNRGAEDERNVSITIGPGGELAIDRDTVEARDFGRILHERLEQPENAGVLVVVRADAESQYTRVGEILEEARIAGAQRLAIATRHTPVAGTSSHRDKTQATAKPVAPPEAER